MTNKDRVLATLSHKQADKVPYCITFTQAARKKMAAFYGDDSFEAGLGNCFINLSTDPAPAEEEIRPDIWMDPFGVQWDRSIDKDIGAVVNTVINRDNYTRYPFPDPDDPTRYSDYENVITQNPDGFFVVGHGWTLFERAWTLSGMQNFLIALMADREYAEGLLDRITEWDLQVIDNICKYNIDAIRLGDDWGQQRGLIMGPDLWREYFKPRIYRLYQRIRSHGKIVIQHSCGKVDELFDDLIECGLDVFNPFQPEVCDVYRMKELYGDRLSFWGGISTQRLLPYGTVNQVKEEVQKMIEVVGKGGAYIAAPAHDIPADARPENVAAMIDVLQNQ